MSTDLLPRSLLSLAFDVLGGLHWRDPQSLPREALGDQGLIAQSLPSGLRVAYAPALFGARADPGVQRVVRAAVQRITAGPQLCVDECLPERPDPFEIFETLWVIGRRAVYGRASQGHVDQVDPWFMPTVPVLPFAAEADGPADWNPDSDLPGGCGFADRCPRAEARCLERPPQPLLRGSQSYARCFMAEG